MNSFKATIKGKLAFGNVKTYEMMIAHYTKRLEQYYKNDIMLKGMGHFVEDNFSITVPRTELTVMSEKTYKNTIGLLNELRGYAVAGCLNIWILTEDNKLIQEVSIQPQGDKFATQEYNRACMFLLKSGKEEDAVNALTKAIDKYEDYEQAYERRGVANHRIGRLEESILDFTKSISLMPNPEAYFGRALAKQAMGDLVGAITDLDLAIKNAIPLQAIFWSARRVKGEFHLQLEQHDKAVFELKLVTKRAFKPSDKNYLRRRHAWQLYGTALEKLGNKEEANFAYQQASTIPPEMPKIPHVPATVAKSVASPMIPA